MKTFKALKKNENKNLRLFFLLVRQRDENG